MKSHQKQSQGGSEGLQARRLAVHLLKAVLRDRQPFDEAFAASGAKFPAQLPPHPNPLPEGRGKGGQVSSPGRSSGVLSPLGERDRVRGSLQPFEFRDRAFARAIAATALRRLGQIEDLLSHFLQKPLPAEAFEARSILIAAAAQLAFMEVAPHAAISLAVEQAKQSRGSHRYAGVINAVLRKVSANAVAIIAAQDAALLNTPDWLFRRWAGHYGEEVARKIAAAHLEEPPLDLSVKADAAAWATRLGGTLLPWSTVRLTVKGRIEDIEGYPEGAWWVQDAAAALPALLLGDVRGKRVADLCAAPGGKTAQLAARGAHVTAVDFSASRLRRLQENLARLGLGAEAVQAGAAEWTPPQLFDAVLLDAPCSATGTIRRNPDIPYLKSGTDIAALSAVQARLLDHALSLLKPGGQLVYSTCSLEAEEGEAQIERVLALRCDVALAPIDFSLHGEVSDASLDHQGGQGRLAITGGSIPPPECVMPSGMLRTLPFHSGGMDGFFAARLIREA